VNEADRPNEKKNLWTFAASWGEGGVDNGEAPKLKGARRFYFAELKKATDNFSESNEIGAGGYGKVVIQAASEKNQMSKIRYDKPETLNLLMICTLKSGRCATFCDDDAVWWQVYKGVLPEGDLVAVKRAQKESMQGAHEFKTEIEILSRVHHRNLVNLVGFCYEQGEQMLVYEFMVNGTLRDWLLGQLLHWTSHSRQIT
jgi:serine/threonine protein kinase